MSAGIKAVGLNRAEGPVGECYAVVFSRDGELPRQMAESGRFKAARVVRVDGDICEEVRRKLNDWSRSSPKPGEGYDKTDFMVAWDNGETYEGRFDLQRGGGEDGETFWESLRRRIRYYACAWRPAHFKDAHWRHHCEQAEKEGWKAWAEKVLAECHVPAA